MGRPPSRFGRECHARSNCRRAEAPRSQGRDDSEIRRDPGNCFELRGARKFIADHGRSAPSCFFVSRKPSLLSGADVGPA